MRLLLFGVAATLSAATFDDVRTILEKHCVACHSKGGIAPMPLTSYGEARPWAQAIAAAVSKGKMPPWFADPLYGTFANDPQLSAAERNTVEDWVVGGALSGSSSEPIRVATMRTTADLTLRSAAATQVPAKGSLEYQYTIIPTGLTADRWIISTEVIPLARSVVHHAVVYIREPGEMWTSGPTRADILGVYAPGRGPETLPPGMAKLLKAGSDLIVELHYTPNGKAVRDRPSVALTFAKSPPTRRVHTLQMDNATFRIPPGERDHRVTVSGTLPNDALLLSFYPHMHLRGKTFEFNRIGANGQPETMLRVENYDFHWQLSYKLKEPLSLLKGTRLRWAATFDNSKNNPSNPDPSAEVRYGHQSWAEMMIGFFDVAVDPAIDKKAFFVRQD